MPVEKPAKEKKSKFYRNVVEAIYAHGRHQRYRHLSGTTLYSSTSSQPLGGHTSLG
jgi:hypothetical protein